MTPYASQNRYTFAALKGGKVVSTVDTYDGADPRKAAYRRFKRLKIDFDKIEFLPDVSKDVS